jgi:hypothetical protein
MLIDRRHHLDAESADEIQDHCAIGLTLHQRPGNFFLGTAWKPPVATPRSVCHTHHDVAPNVDAHSALQVVAGKGVEAVQGCYAKASWATATAAETDAAADPTMAAAVFGFWNSRPSICSRSRRWPTDVNFCQRWYLR